MERQRDYFHTIEEHFLHLIFHGTYFVVHGPELRVTSEGKPHRLTVSTILVVETLFQLTVLLLDGVAQIRNSAQGIHKNNETNSGT